MNTHRFVDYTGKFGVTIGYVFVAIKSVTPIVTGPGGDPLLFVSLVTAPFLFRRLVKQRTRKNINLQRTATESRYAGYWSSIGLWLLIPTSAGLVAFIADGSSGAVRGITVGFFHVIVAAIFGIGAAKGEAKRVLKSDGNNSSSRGGSLAWSIYGVVNTSLFAAAFLLPTKANHSGDDNQRQAANEIEKSLRKQNKEGMDNVVKQLDTTGTYQPSVEELSKRRELRDTFVAGLPEDQYKRYYEAFARVTKSLEFASAETTKTSQELNKAGGIFDPKNLVTHDAIKERKRLLSEHEAANHAYRARIESVRGLIARELKNAGSLTDSQQESVGQKWFLKLHTDVILALIETNEQSIAVGYATLALFDQTCETRGIDNVGRPLFATDKEVENYNSLLSQMEKHAQSQEVLLRRLASIAKEAGANK